MGEIDFIAGVNAGELFQTSFGIDLESIGTWGLVFVALKATLSFALFIYLLLFVISGYPGMSAFAKLLAKRLCLLVFGDKKNN